MPHSPETRRVEARGLRRERLERQLDSSAAPISVVIGPAGSGKTVLLQHLAGGVGEPVHWWRPGADYLPDDFSLAVVETGARGPGRTWLIADGLDDLSAAEIDDVLEVVLARRTPGLRCVIATRAHLSPVAVELAARGDLDLVTAAQLRFRSWEVDDLFRTTYGTPIGAERATALCSQLDGWAAGLQLARLAVDSGTTSSRDVEPLDPEVLDLVWSHFERHVVLDLDDDDHEFLILTSPLGLLTSALGDALLDDDTSAVRIDRLARRHLLIAIPGERRAYRCHAVLRARLQKVLADRLDRSTWRSMHRRAGQLLEEGGWASEAIRPFALAESWGDVSRLLRVQTTRVSDETVRWLQRRQPERARRDPGFLLAEARRSLSRGAFQTAAETYDRAAASTGDVGLVRDLLDERASALLWSPSPPPASGEPPRSEALAEIRQVTRQVKPGQLPTTPLARGLRALLHAQLDAATAAFQEIPQTGDAPSLAVELGGRLALAATDVVRGRPGASTADVEQIFLLAESADLPWFGRQAQAVRHVLRSVSGDPTEVAPLGGLFDDCVRDEDRWGAVLIAILAGLLALRTSPGPGLLRILTRAVDLAAGLDAPAIELRLDVLRTAIHLRTLVHPDAISATADSAVGADVDRSEVPAQAPSPAAAGPGGSELRCLGFFSVRVGGQLVDFSTLRPRPRSVLMLLAMHQGRALHRERLVDVFWPELDFRSGLRGLQVAVAEIRRCLRPHQAATALHRAGDSYVLQFDDMWDQLAEFELLATRCDRSRQGRDASEDLRLRLAAVELYGGELLPEAGPAEWVVFERDRLRGLATRFTAEAAELALGLRAYAVGIAAARRSLALDPHQDRPWSLLVQLQEAMGDRRAADQSRRDHARARADDVLGITPPAPAVTSPVRRRPPPR